MLIVDELGYEVRLEMALETVMGETITIRANAAGLSLKPVVKPVVLSKYSS